MATSMAVQKYFVSITARYDFIEATFQTQATFLKFT